MRRVGCVDDSQEEMVGEMNGIFGSGKAVHGPSIM